MHVTEDKYAQQHTYMTVVSNTMSLKFIILFAKIVYIAHISDVCIHGLTLSITTFPVFFGLCHVHFHTADMMVFFAHRTLHPFSV